MAAKLSGAWLAGRRYVSAARVKRDWGTKKVWLVAIGGAKSIGLIGRPSDSLHSMLTPRRVARKFGNAIALELWPADSTKDFEL
jgi:hypothetical protein